MSSLTNSSLSAWSALTLRHPSSSDDQNDQRKLLWKRVLQAILFIACGTSVILIIILFILLITSFSDSHGLPMKLETNIMVTHVMRPLFVYMEGMNQMKIFGKYIRIRYIDGPPFAKETQINIRATGGNASLESARNILLGMKLMDYENYIEQSNIDYYETNPIYNCSSKESPKATRIDSDHGWSKLVPKVTMVALMANFWKLNSVLAVSRSKSGPGASFIFELWRIDRRYMVKILYALNYNAAPVIATAYVDGCNGQFIFCFLKDLLPKWKKLYYTENEEKRKCKTYLARKMLKNENYNQKAASPDATTMKRRKSKRRINHTEAYLK
ncbi:unnamed protein product [Thelazia callipaeda]|uniref:Membralin n=1 Tax=Thelazia callipaeda TaxID=103827 RepID=A0A0N5CZ70_THECL|nr:unnamed protein product [Thelazia callipaeda]